MIEIRVQLAPTGTTSLELQVIVAKIISDAGLQVDGWIKPPGEREPGAPGPPISAPTLQIVIVKAPDEGSDKLNNVRPLLAAALSAIQQRLPTLPLGFQVADAENRRWYTFRPAETAEAVCRGAALPDEPTSESGAFGWSDDDRSWIAL